jgi:penicillin-binding protein 1B
VIYPSMLLGATPLTPFEVTQMFQVIANSGYFSPLTTIREVTDDHFNLLTRVPISSQEIFNRRTMIQLQRALIGVTEEGTARYLKQRFEDKTFAGKTGTTNDLRDSWFAGFANRYLTVVWLGDDDNQPIGLTGSSGALRVWADIMQRVDDSSIKLSPDPDLEWIYVDEIKGGKTQKGCETAALLPFIKGTQPDFTTECQQSYLERGIRWLQDQF